MWITPMYLYNIDGALRKDYSRYYNNSDIYIYLPIIDEALRADLRLDCWWCDEGIIYSVPSTSVGNAVNPSVLYLYKIKHIKQ